MNSYVYNTYLEFFLFILIKIIVFIILFILLVIILLQLESRLGSLSHRWWLLFCNYYRLLLNHRSYVSFHCINSRFLVIGAYCGRFLLWIPKVIFYWLLLRLSFNFFIILIQVFLLEIISNII